MSSWTVPLDPTHAVTIAASARLANRINSRLALAQTHAQPNEGVVNTLVSFSQFNVSGECLGGAMSVLDQSNLFRRSFTAVAGSAVATAKVHNLRKRGFTPPIKIKHRLHCQNNAACQEGFVKVSES